MTSIAAVEARTALSPEWDHGFDEAFADLISGDADLVRTEFDALIGASWNEPPAPPAPPARSTARPEQSPAAASTPEPTSVQPVQRTTEPNLKHQRSPP